jgi:hypothetical protein
MPDRITLLDVLPDEPEPSPPPRPDDPLSRQPDGEPGAASARYPAEADAAGFSEAPDGPPRGSS